MRSFVAGLRVLSVGLGSYPMDLFTLAQRAGGGPTSDRVGASTAGKDAREAYSAWSLRFNLYHKTLSPGAPPPFEIEGDGLAQLRDAIATQASLHAGVELGLFPALSGTPTRQLAASPPHPTGCPAPAAAPGPPGAGTAARKRGGGASPASAGANKNGPRDRQGARVSWALSPECGYSEKGDIVEWGPQKWSLSKLANLWKVREAALGFPGSLALVARGGGSWNIARRFVSEGIKGDHLAAVQRWHADDCQSQCFC